MARAGGGEMKIKVSDFSIICEWCQSKDVKMTLKERNEGLGTIHLILKCKNCGHSIDEMVGLAP
jgi:uncharacterized Zn finger protein